MIIRNGGINAELGDDRWQNLGGDRHRRRHGYQAAEHQKHRAGKNVDDVFTTRSREEICCDLAGICIGAIM